MTLAFLKCLHVPQGIVATHSVSLEYDKVIVFSSFLQIKYRF